MFWKKKNLLHLVKWSTGLLQEVREALVYSTSVNVSGLLEEEIIPCGVQAPGRRSVCVKKTLFPHFSKHLSRVLNTGGIIHQSVLEKTSASQEHGSIYGEKREKYANNQDSGSNQIRDKRELQGILQV